MSSAGSPFRVICLNCTHGKRTLLATLPSRIQANLAHLGHQPARRSCHLLSAALHLVRMSLLIDVTARCVSTERDRVVPMWPQGSTLSSCFVSNSNNATYSIVKIYRHASPQYAAAAYSVDFPAGLLGFWTTILATLAGQTSGTGRIQADARCCSLAGEAMEEASGCYWR